MTRLKKSDPAPFVTDDPPAPNTSALARYLDRVESVEKEIAALNRDKKEIWAELKSEGFDPVMARKAHALRKLNREKRLVLGTYVDLLSLFE